MKQGPKRKKVVTPSAADMSSSSTTVYLSPEVPPCPKRKMFCTPRRVDRFKKSKAKRHYTFLTSTPISKNLFGSDSDLSEMSEGELICRDSLIGIRVICDTKSEDDFNIKDNMNDVEAAIIKCSIAKGSKSKEDAELPTNNKIKISKEPPNIWPIKRSELKRGLRL